MVVDLAFVEMFFFDRVVSIASKPGKGCGKEKRQERVETGGYEYLGIVYGGRERRIWR